jgi:hypothetical protein
LRRHIWTQRRDFPRFRLDESQNVRRIERAKPALENLGELEDRGGDRGVAMKRKAIEHPAGELSPGRRLLRQKVTHPRRERMLERTGH